MQIPNPNQSQPFDRILRDASGQKVWGIRNEHTPNEEIVYIPTGKSNQEYFMPDLIATPEGCQHHFVFVNPREIECTFPTCGLAVQLHVVKNLKEQNGKAFVIINNQDYEISSL